MRKLLSILVLAIFVMPGIQHAQGMKKKAKATSAKTSSTTPNYNTLPPGVMKGASVEGITEYFLANGMQVLLYPDNSKQTMTVNITYKVGSRHEGYGETGMAHLLEHMVFKGTKKRPLATSIPNELSKHGARPNGTTWYDRTNYFETFAATDENLNWALDLESDRMVNSRIDKKDLDTEMSVVRNEFESGENDPSGVLMERVLSTGFLWHNYGKSTIGARADIEKVPIERLQAFYKKYYQPDNAVLMVAGKIDEKKTIWLVHDYFSKIPKPERKLIPTYTDEPTQDGERNVKLKRVGDVQALACMYHIPPGSHPDAAAIDILTDIMTIEPSGRLYKALVETKKASSQFGWCATLKEPGFVYFGAQVRKENSLDEAREIMLKTLDDIVATPPSKEEVDRARNKQIKDFDLFFKNTEQVGRAISEYIGMGDWRLGFIYRDNISKVTAEDVQRVALTYFKPDNRTIGMFIPEAKPDRSEIPAAPDVEALVKNYKGNAIMAQGEEFDPSPANIESRLLRGQEPNSIKYVLLPKSTKGNLVNANLTLRFGNEMNLKGKSTISNFTASMLDKGTTTRTRQQIKDEFDKLKARVGFYGGGGSVSVNIQTTKENLNPVLNLVTEILKQPAFPEKEFEELRNEELAGIEEQKSDPQALVGNAITRHLNQYPKDDIRYVQTIDEEIQSTKDVKLEDCKKFYQDFYGADHATISVVGDFDEKEVKSIISKDLGSWKSASPYKRIEDLYMSPPAVNENIETPDKANAMFLAGMNLNVRDDDPDYPALILGNYMLGGGFLNSRLATRIRQKEGISYGVGSQLYADSQDKSGGFMIYAIYAPENRDRLEAAYKEEIEKMLKDGFSAEEIKDAKSGYLQSRKVARSQDGQLSGSLNSMLNIGRTMKFTEDFENKINALTPEQITSALRKHIDLSKMSVFKGGDFANKLKKP